MASPEGTPQTIFEDLTATDLEFVSEGNMLYDLKHILASDDEAIDKRMQQVAQNVFAAAKEAAGWIFIEEVPHSYGFDLTKPQDYHRFMKGVMYGILMGTAAFVKDGFDFSDEEADVPHESAG